MAVTVTQTIVVVCSDAAEYASAQVKLAAQVGLPEIDTIVENAPGLTLTVTYTDYQTEV